ncbi:hypothetical protein CH249_14065 [Rhodococcus sp. 05-2255-3B1]|uniref:hypothetical protein n=1 Tax=unclassified Rhodococcus (in: high G+C Gram-positive bacteria) TaxID=192944 RepID=UPI000B9ABFC2|nr:MULTISPECIES: hypothetical protein [unclassified Rhodococcus (in: high G+C Gram-positive bacteria)]OZE10251.1 hypothetical protein CH249_14065 [Rhodococcus sp. 05-2255-3B1]OZE20155.1 hypothetical protein CH255_10165 [Rhodococcus sp. 05-2255-2A2]
MTPKIRIPFAPGAVREALHADADLIEHVPKELITTRDIPENIVRPFIVIRGAGTKGDDPMLRKPFVQIDVFAPPPAILRSEPHPILADPEEVAWDLAGLCGEIIGHTTARQFRNCSWNGRWIDGPGNGPQIDRSRGEDMPLYRQTVRVELTVTVREHPTFWWG